MYVISITSLVTSVDDIIHLLVMIYYRPVVFGPYGLQSSGNVCIPLQWVVVHFCMVREGEIEEMCVTCKWLCTILQCQFLVLSI